jgi:hypothetical protein
MGPLTSPGASVISWSKQLTAFRLPFVPQIEFKTWDDRKIFSDAPFAQVFVGVSASQYDRLKALNEPVPDVRRVWCLFDTGSVGSFADPALIAALGLEALGTREVEILMGARAACSTYQASIYLATPNGERELVWSRGDIALFATEIPNGVDLVLGRNFLAFCDFTYSPRSQTFSLRF